MLRSYAGALTAALSLALVASFTLVAPAAPVPHHLMKPPVYYFPTKVGAKLTYQEPGSDTQRTLVVTSVADHDGVKIVSLSQARPDGITSPYSTMAVTGGGLYCLGRGNHKLESPEVWLQLPVEHGRCWEYYLGSSGLVSAPKVTNTITGEEEVTVSAGTFRCVRVETRQNERPATYWFTPEVGLVKVEAINWTEELKSYSCP